MTICFVIPPGLIGFFGAYNMGKLMFALASCALRGRGMCPAPTPLGCQGSPLLQLLPCSLPPLNFGPDKTLFWVTQYNGTHDPVEDALASLPIYL